MLPSAIRSLRQFETSDVVKTQMSYALFHLLTNDLATLKSSSIL